MLFDALTWMLYLSLFIFPQMAYYLPVLMLSLRPGRGIQIVLLIYYVYVILTSEAMSFIVNVYSVLFACPGLGCYLWGLIKNRTQLFGGTGVDGFQPPTSFFPFRPAKTVFENIEFPFDVKDSIMLLLVLLCLLCTVYTMFRVRKVPFREVGWTPALGADNAEWHGKWEAISQYLEKFSPPMTWKFTPEQLQDPVSMIRLVKEKCSGSSRDGQLTATCWALATAYRALLDMIQHCQGEERRTKSADTTSTQTTAESEGERNEPTSTVSTQTIEEPEEQAKPIAVAPVQKRKSKTKSVRIANDDEEAGPSHPPEETEPEIITRSLSLGELRELRREFTRQANESILTWLLRIWDAAANDTILDGSEARQLGSLSRDVVIDQGIGRRQETLSLWRRLLSSVRERYLCKEDLHVQQGQWNTMEQGIRCLRELAVLEIIFSEDERFPKSPDGVQCTSQMWLKFARLGPEMYSRYLATLQWREGEDKVGALVSKLRIYEDTVTAPLRAHVSSVETKLAEHVRNLEEKIEEGHQKLREEIKEGIFHISPGRTRVSAIRSQRPPAKERRYTPRGDLWFYLREHGEDMRKWDGKPTSSLAARVRELKRGTNTIKNSSRVNVAPVSRGQDSRRYRNDDTSDPLEGTSRSYPQEEHNEYHDQD
ncbi:uncharacterized protein LOC127461275 [Manacus candei]|uniref:uncharacterized protein LOC127461275 n=1 Tax=Manacus candei TaxID=415023 RepID=UPI00222699AA|nr:uncharacterized protein LOC127461275 [Manacus candei]